MAVQGFKFSDGTVVKYDYPALDNITTDKTLSIENAAADGKAVGEELTTIKEDLSQLGELEVYVEGTTLVINTNLTDGNEVSY